MAASLEIQSDNTEEAKALMREAVQNGLKAVGFQAEDYAKLLCPVDTGRLRDSITHTNDEDSAYIGTNVEYAAYVEYGTSKTVAQPFLEPAATQHSEEYKAIFEYYCRNA